MRKFIIPTNFKYANKFLGIIEYRVLLPLTIYAGIIFFILYLLKLDFFFSIGIFIVLVGPPTILLSVGIQGENVFPYLMNIIKFKKSARVYLYIKSKQKYY